MVEYISDRAGRSVKWPRPLKTIDIIFGRTTDGRKKRFAYLMILPSVSYFIIMFAYPTTYAFYLSLHTWSLAEPLRFVGFAHWKSVLEDPLFLRSMMNTFYFVILSVPSIVLLSLSLALLFNSATRWFKAKDLFKAIYFVPVITSFVAIAWIWNWLYQPTYGLINDVLARAGLPPQMWLWSATQVIPSLAIMQVWARVGFEMMVFIAGLESIPEVYYEAAEVDGASTWSVFRCVTLPLLNPQILLVTVIELIFALKIFELPYVTTMGGPGNASLTIVLYIYRSAFRFMRMGEGCAMAIMLFAIIMVLTLLQWRSLRRPLVY